MVLPGLFLTLFPSFRALLQPSPCFSGHFSFPGCCLVDAFAKAKGCWGGGMQFETCCGEDAESVLSAEDLYGIKGLLDGSLPPSCGCYEEEAVPSSIQTVPLQGQQWVEDGKVDWCLVRKAAFLNQDLLPSYRAVLQVDTSSLGSCPLGMVLISLLDAQMKLQKGLHADALFRLPSLRWINHFFLESEQPASWLIEKVIEGRWASIFEQLLNLGTLVAKIDRFKEELDKLKKNFFEPPRLFGLDYFEEQRRPKNLEVDIIKGMNRLLEGGQQSWSSEVDRRPASNSSCLLLLDTASSLLALQKDLQNTVAVHLDKSNSRNSAPAVYRRENRFFDLFLDECVSSEWPLAGWLSSLEFLFRLSSLQFSGKVAIPLLRGGTWAQQTHILRADDLHLDFMEVKKFFGERISDSDFEFLTRKIVTSGGAEDGVSLSRLDVLKKYFSVKNEILEEPLILRVFPSREIISDFIRFAKFPFCGMWPFLRWARLMAERAEVDLVVEVLKALDEVDTHHESTDLFASFFSPGASAENTELFLSFLEGGPHLGDCGLWALKLWEGYRKAGAVWRGWVQDKGLSIVEPVRLSFFGQFVEPLGDASSLIRYSLLESQIEEYAQVISKALSDGEEVEKKLFYFQGRNGQATLEDACEEGSSWCHSSRVQATSVDSSWPQQQLLGSLKLSVNGEELKTLEGARTLLARRRVCSVMMHARKMQVGAARGEPAYAGRVFDLLHHSQMKVIEYIEPDPSQLGAWRELRTAEDLEEILLSPVEQVPVHRFILARQRADHEECFPLVHAPGSWPFEEEGREFTKEGLESVLR